ncbi:MAG TPA: MFS transporter [Oligoflexus sp.]|uniref:MFS transporter n=1 Tax=Oligoflexus sp. TaxID=1971216 RepID=UPI002D7F37EB|nr:MFS transporter [Oligoflexus sp.]HET9237484.1 MFS transporter [Oligoflexus sp.]
MVNHVEDKVLVGPAPDSAWKPLAISPYGRMWFAALVSNIGGFMQNVGAAWFLTVAGLSATWLGGLQAASALPMFLFGLFAGVLADLRNRRTIILAAQVWLILTSGLLAWFAYSGILTPLLLLALSFSMGIGSAFHMPAWTATLPRLVPKDQLAAAVALSGVSVNLARAVGPALGGAVISASSVAVTFFCNALTFIFVLAIVWTWHPTPAQSPTVRSSEKYLAASKLSLIYAWRSPGVRAVLVRSFVALFAAGALWALLPLRARNDLGLSSGGLGFLLGCVGTGSVAGVFLLGQVRRRGMPIDHILSAGATIFALSTFIAATEDSFIVVSLALAVGGIGWIAMMATFNLCAQISVAGWVQARAVALFLVITQGAMALSGIAWGYFSDLSTVSTALGISAAALILQIALTRIWPLSWLSGRDLTPSETFAKKVAGHEFKDRDGPIEVRISYHVPPDKKEVFLAALYELRNVRLRDGGYDWNVLCTPHQPDIYEEVFWISTWADHLLQHERLTKADEDIYQRVQSFHVGDSVPAVVHRTAVKAEDRTV